MASFMNNGNWPVINRIILANRIHAVTGVFLVIFLISCSTGRKAIREPLKAEGPEYLFQKLNENELKFDWFSARFSADYTENKKKTSFNGQIRIRRDSIIWISVSAALGIEMLRICITADSVKLLNRIESTFFASDFQYLNKQMNRALDFDMLQAFITGNDFAFYEQEKFQAFIDNGEYKLLTTNRHKLKKYMKAHEPEIVIPVQQIWLDPENFKITRIMIRELIDENRKFEAVYGDFAPAGHQLFHQKSNYDIQTTEIRIQVSMELNRISVDEPMGFPFSIPDKYLRVN
jgi:hypothetical protein